MPDMQGKLFSLSDFTDNGSIISLASDGGVISNSLKNKKWRANILVLFVLRRNGELNLSLLILL